ncbi:hypothetical protein TTHERM_01000200 (macronuclear) [Tetrahymena thermophila SB210]|uniref:Nbr1 FW domain-containing protein n=1 Tax=Tetrahymena thermophila (strain SB210) TaxID=312017 RepID=Q24HK4_TETTS|nr:hypothetical protein TTHERM_01000200 [Tetrahymena thermophila SB210]EAS07227.1 hypothetical protein TTHERM_01000200 [Tetrahymena thermophila SB210]|eukprot:XP_001027469.1 hypothetical protein TTHERM_01000200 [Tetrahymena thermophila SB210]
MNIGFKIEIKSNIYKLPGRILTYAQLVDQIKQNFKDRIPLKFKINYSFNDDSQSLIVSCEQEFKQLIACAAERNMKNIKLKIVESTDEDNILNDLDESLFNLCELMDCFDLEDPQLNQNYSLSCIDKSVNNEAGLFSEGGNAKTFASQCDLEEKLNQLEMAFSQADAHNIENTCQNNRDTDCNLESALIQNEKKIERVINLDESAIIFIRSENYSPMPLNQEQEQSIELIGNSQLQERVNNNSEHIAASSCKYCCMEKQQKSTQQGENIQMKQFIRCDNQIKFFCKLNENQLEQTKIPSFSSLNNRLLNQDLDCIQSIEIPSYVNQILPHSASQFTPLISNLQNIIKKQNDLPFDENFSSSISKSTRSNHSRTKEQELHHQNDQLLSQPFQQLLYQSNSFSQSPICSQLLNQNQKKNLISQNFNQNFTNAVANHEEFSNTTSQTAQEQVLFPHANNRRKSKTTITHVPIPSKLTNSIFVDNGNQSTVDQSQISFLNGSNQTNLGTNSILSRKVGKFPDQSLNQSITLNEANINNTQKLYPYHCSQHLTLKQSPQLNIYCSQKIQSHQMNNFYNSSNADDFKNQKNNLQVMQNKITVSCDSNNNYAKQSTCTLSPESTLENDRGRRQSQKFQVCSYRAKVMNSPKKQLIVAPNASFTEVIQLKNNGEFQWPQNVLLKCIEGVYEGQSQSIESAQTQSVVTSIVNFVAPNQIGISKISFRLCYNKDEEQLKYFGPKITFELNIKINTEIDNQQDNCGAKQFNSKDASTNLIQSSQTVQFVQFPQNSCNLSQNKDDKISTSCCSIPSQNLINLQQYKQYLNQNSINTIVSATSTSISPIKSTNNQNCCLADMHNKVNCSKFENVFDFNIEQKNVSNIDQFYLLQKSNINNLPFRRSINSS